MRVRSRHELRCLCLKEHLLALYGLDAAGRPYFHVTTHKGGRVLCNVVFRGDAEFECPACGHWTRITVRAGGRLDRDMTCERPIESLN